MSEQPSPSTNHSNNITTAITSPQQPHSPGMPLPMTMPTDNNRTSPARDAQQGGPPPPHSGRPDYSYGGYPPPYSPYPPPYPPYGYPGPPPPHYPGGYGAPPPPHYGYAPPPYSTGRYPSQQPSSNNNKQPQQQQQTPSNNDTTKRRKSPVRKSPPKSSNNNKASPTNSTNNNNSNVAEDIELERLRAAAEPMQVAPMRSDFHFFMDDQRDEVEKQVKSSGEYNSGDDKYLLFSNMNARIMKLWEDATTETRACYMSKEEEDRKRFMSEDEIASRHCATLTARAKSPRKEEQQQQESAEEGESPPKKVKMEDETNTNDMNTTDDDVDAEEKVE
mmetsp:Transcript_20117/g.29859  ORF Transcript_20117/g.29859 Transcript_20117/m.29859 type:complete len:333 (+) Transcript_20117:563-1561(+)|eukprot:CAMPEP_0194227684 /NCGR_PEP_ID=MMETSP0156-20130528/42985_1 /TAXON_ID=33649 /ORGANISM="Thalassionema nitzschioides, Strain L26-B" /LENGTH=332 /DNA_ID=CAMNT_0038960177 /DNA_START=630 /DNA_END=1628 /DNA_ORIENTATION=-